MLILGHGKLIMKRINVKRDFGARGNGNADDYRAFQDANDYLTSVGGGILYAPQGVYMVSQPFLHRDFVTLLGDGNKTIIKNDILSSTGKDQFCILIGNYAPSDYELCQHVNVVDIPAGANSVTLVDINHLSLFKIGDTILVDSLFNFVSADGHKKPYYAFINRIISINYSTGVLLLEDPIATGISGAQIAPTNQLGENTYICKEPVVRNIRFESRGDWSLRFGVYKGVFHSISMKTTDVIPGNGFSWCRWTNINAEFSQKVIETAMYSHNTTIDGLTAVWYDGPDDLDGKPLIKMGENMRSCWYNNINIISGEGRFFEEVIRCEHAFSNLVTNCTFDCPNVTESGIEVGSTSGTSLVLDNKFNHNRFYLRDDQQYIRVRNTNFPDGARVEHNWITENTFSGPYSFGTVRLNGSVETNVVANNTFL
jgi:hypothetical protein